MPKNRQQAPSTPVPQDELTCSFHKKLLDRLYDGVYFVNVERQITYWNEAATTLTGYSAPEALGKHCFDNFLMHVDEQGCALCMNGCPLTNTMGDGQPREAEVFLKHKLGHRVPVCVRVTPITDDAGGILGAVEVFSDASRKKDVERRVDELENLAFCDPLTGISNRRYTTLKVEQALQEHQQFGRPFGVMMIDIDEFKQVNDIGGHDTGDAILRAVSRTLVHSLRSVDTVGRWGGDEFLVILADVTQKSLRQLAERCRRLIAQSAVPMDDVGVHVTVSIGAALIRADQAAGTAIKKADQLMYQSKAAGRNRVTTG
jgi:diguanylate cyclase (GGDEF)-like protein/PAS domain S-box-containing protein